MNTSYNLKELKGKYNIKSILNNYPAFAIQCDSWEQSIKSLEILEPLKLPVNGQWNEVYPFLAVRPGWNIIATTHYWCKEKNFTIIPVEEFIAANTVSNPEYMVIPPPVIKKEEDAQFFARWLDKQRELDNIIWFSVMTEKDKAFSKIYKLFKEEVEAGNITADEA